MGSSAAPYSAGPPPSVHAIGKTNEAHMREWIGYAMSRDPLQAMQLDLLWGIRRWVEYIFGAVVVGMVILILMGSQIIQALSRLAL